MTESNPSSLDGMIERMEREAFDKWARTETLLNRISNNELIFAWAAWRARAALASQCRGVAHPGCNYLAPCGSVCDKCGAKT